MMECLCSTGFHTLRSLCLEGVEEWAPDNLGALGKLVSRLVALHLSISQPIREVRGASHEFPQTMFALVYAPRAFVIGWRVCQNPLHLRQQNLRTSTMLNRDIQSLAAHS